MKTILKSAMIMGCALFASQAALAETLRLANWLPPSHPLVADVMVPFGESIKTATDGRVTVNMLPAPLGPPAGAI